MEIPGSFLAKVDVGSLRLQGIAQTSVRELEDSDKDGEPDRAVTFSGQALVGRLRVGVNEVELTGKMQDGTPVRGTQKITVR